MDRQVLQIKLSKINKKSSRLELKIDKNITEHIQYTMFNLNLKYICDNKSPKAFRNHSKHLEITHDL